MRRRFRGVRINRHRARCRCIWGASCWMYRQRLIIEDSAQRHGRPMKREPSTENSRKARKAPRSKTRPRGTSATMPATRERHGALSLNCTDVEANKTTMHTRVVMPAKGWSKLVSVEYGMLSCQDEKGKSQLFDRCFKLSDLFRIFLHLRCTFLSFATNGNFSNSSPQPPQCQVSHFITSASQIQICPSRL